MWIPNAFWPTFISAAINLFLVVYIIKADIRKAGNLAAFLMFLSIFIWSVGELLERIAGPPNKEAIIAFFGARFLFIGIALLSGSFIHFLIDYPYRLKINEKVRKSLLYAFYTISLIGIAIDLADDFLGHVIIAREYSYQALGQNVWGLDPGPVYKFYITWLFLLGLVLLVGLLLKLRNVKMNIVRLQIKYTFAGLLIAYILVTLTGYIPVLLGITVYPLTTVSFSIMGIFVIYTIYRYRMFIVVPTSETKELQEELPEMGYHTLPKEEAYRKFANLARSGYKSLGFISQDAEKFKERFNLKATPIFEITKMPGKDRLNPQIEEHREMIPFIISTFMEEVKNPVILIDLTAKHIDDTLRKEIIEEIKGVCGERGVFIVAS